ncbi:type II 3-dehydroquinate dehydratase [Desulfovibrionales bacterium]
MDILVLNGPNLGHLGQRQPDLYGSLGMEAVPDLVRTVLGNQADAVQLAFFQSNSEGALIDRLEQAWQDKTDGIVFNAGAYTHTSLALADCLAWISIPCVEVHISNVLARSTPLRHVSLMGRHCLGSIAGFGLLGYALAVQALVQYLAQP